MDPSTTTREAFTRQILASARDMLPAGTNTNAEWARLMGKLASLLEKLAGHEAMKDNMKQPYMTPAASKNRIYFVWDFVGRTMSTLGQIDPTTDPANMTKPQKAAWSDAVGRSVMIKELIVDSKPGMLNMMVEGSDPRRRGQNPEFGTEIVELARTI